MKKIFQLKLVLISMLLWISCDKHDYAIGELSPIINVERLRLLYKEGELVLTANNLDGAKTTVGTVISDHSGGNIPDGVMVIQSERGGMIRGVALAIGGEAANYSVGDSVHVNLQGATLKRVNGTLQVIGLTAQSLEKVASNRPIKIRSVSVVNIVSKPEEYEGTLVTVFGNNYTPNAGIETLLGDKVFNDGTGEMQLHVGTGASLASRLLPYSANTTGLIFKSDADVFQIWPRTNEDFISTSIVVDPNIPLGKTPIVITGFLADPTGGDANHEYVQFMATQDLDFNVTPFSVAVCANGGALTPTGAPVKGWVTGGQRTYKFNIITGTAAKGTFFYVGGYKKIWGSNSTDIGAANWVANTLYGSMPGADGVGDPATSGMLANSGNPVGIAIFKGIKIDETSVPFDVLFYGGPGGAIYSAGPPESGYRINNTDYFEVANANEGFFRKGSNTKIYAFPSTANFAKLGGVYNTSQKKWTTLRDLSSYALGNNSTIVDLENGPTNTKLE